MATTRVGISGWRYGPWRGTFYPKGLPQRAELEYASARLPVIEINGSFYSLQLPGLRSVQSEGQARSVSVAVSSQLPLSLRAAFLELLPRDMRAPFDAQSLMKKLGVRWGGQSPSPAEVGRRRKPVARRIATTARTVARIPANGTSNPQ
jgi:hypothetical protein